MRGGTVLVAMKVGDGVVMGRQRGDERSGNDESECEVESDEA